MDISPFLKTMVELNASDIFITAGFPPSAKIDGELTPLTETPLTAHQAQEMTLSVMSNKQREEFVETRECNFSFAVKELGRFRVSAFWQRESCGCVMRRIITEIPKFEDLGLPDVLKSLVMAKRGLIIVVGGTGSGKSTTLAAMIGYRNGNSRGHIMTIEDPLEFIHRHNKSIITQREIGIDTESFDAALKNSLRQAPDVILIGEIRSRETMQFALSFAETGHLCMATLHANNANQALDRILHLVPQNKQDQLLFDLSLNLKGIIGQQLVPNIDGEGRCAVIEVLINTPRITSLIQNNELHLLKETMKNSTENGMQTFDQALFELYQSGKISYVDALHYADSANDLRLMIKLKGKDSDDGMGSSLAGVTIDLD